MSEAQLFRLLELRYPSREYALLSQVPTGTGFRREPRLADAVALSHPEWYSRLYVAWQRAMLPRIRQALQFAQHAGVKPMHPMSVLARAYRPDGFPTATRTPEPTEDGQP